MTDARLPCRLLDRHAKGKVPIADDELRGDRYYRHNGNGGVSATHAIKLDLRKRADVGGILYIAHLSLHPCLRADHSAIDVETFAARWIAGDVKKLTLAVCRRSRFVGFSLDHFVSFPKIPSGVGSHREVLTNNA